MVQLLCSTSQIIILILVTFSQDGVDKLKIELRVCFTQDAFRLVKYEL
jgi:hypothetical protein